MYQTLHVTVSLGLKSFFLTPLVIVRSLLHNTGVIQPGAGSQIIGNNK